MYVAGLVTVVLVIVAGAIGSAAFLSIFIGASMVEDRPPFPADDEDD